MKGIVEIIANISQAIVGIGGLYLAFYTLVINKDLVFRNTLQNKQVDELCHLRKVMFDIWFDVYFVKGWADNIKSSGRSLVDFEREQQDDWSQYQAFKKNSMELFYKLQFPEYHLFPKWFDYEKVKSLQKMNEKFAPFTIYTLSNKGVEEVKYWQNELLCRNKIY